MNIFSMDRNYLSYSVRIHGKAHPADTHLFLVCRRIFVDISLNKKYFFLMSNYFHQIDLEKNRL